MRKRSRVLGNKVTPLSPEEIMIRALTARSFLQRFVDNYSSYIDVLRIIERLHNQDLMELEVVEFNELPNEYAVTTPSLRQMKVRQDTYDSARRGEARARFTLAHELGHLFLHRNTVPQFAFSQAPSDHDYIEDVEWQANEFAGWFLVSPEKFEYLKNPRTISVSFGVSMDTAVIMFEKIKRMNSRIN
ncbi:ImmA/IrrE family metallo-endopeptidase [Yersinia rochesterensis]|uniref:ImmA/IrrE family metallo-endopeptidase n=1 Tax=Yersinia rochesterensis TaxID=1604335 RepID=UPI0011A71E41|nr:ImmA/IrrE family metallo-endopeptidase [Yersinia rochesterensis]